MPRDLQRPFVLPAGATDLLLVRHGSSSRGEDAGSPNGGAGQSDPPLTEDGVRQAASVARRLADVPAAGLFVTPLRRTAETAEPIAELLGATPIVVPELREVHLGEWEGQLNARVKQDGSLSRELFRAERWDVIPGAEPMEEFAERVRAGHRGRRRHGGGGRDGDRGRARRGDRRGVPAGHGQPRVRVPLRRELLDHPHRAHAAGPLGAPGLQ